MLKNYDEKKRERSSPVGKKSSRKKNKKLIDLRRVKEC